MPNLARLALLLLLAPVPCALAQTATSAHIVPPPPEPFVLPSYTRDTLPNGLTLLLLPEHNVPLISTALVLRSGATADPAGKAGLATLTSGLLRRGTATRSADAFSNDLDFIGMQFQTDAALDDTSIRANFLAKDQAAALKLLTDAVLHPIFPQAEVSKSLGQLQDQVRATKDQPNQVLGLYLRAFLYGPDAPYGRPPDGDENSLATLTRDDVTSFYRATYTPANAILAVAGDFDPVAMRSAVEHAFGAWQGKAPTHPAIQPTQAVTGRRLLLVDKPDATQTYFAFGNVGIDAVDPNRGSLEVVNTLFGGRFTSLFNTELRIKSGYSYGAFSRFTDLRAPGPFTMSTFTRNATTGPAMDRSLAVLETAHKEGFTDAQLTSAKNSIAGSLPPSLETSEALANTIARNELYGITRDQFNRNLVSLQQTTVPESQRLLATDFPAPDNLVMVVIGKASEIQPLMSKYTSNITLRRISDKGY